MNRISSEINKRLQKINSAYQGITGSNYNAKFKFIVYSGDIEIDNYGNYTPKSSETIEIKAQIHSIKPDAEIQDIALNQTRDYYRVWFLSPLTYKDEIPSTLDCEILINGLWLQGKFNVVRTNISNQLEHSGIRKSLGYSIEGTFEQQTTQRV